MNGMTVFSTQESQIGEDKSENAGFLAALKGDIASELTHRDTFSAFEGEIEDRDVISSYVPIRQGSSDVVGVFEVYDDVTPLLEKISVAQRNIAIGVTLILALLYLILFLIVKRADDLIHQQYIEQQQAEEEIQKAYKHTKLIDIYQRQIVTLRTYMPCLCLKTNTIYRITVVTPRPHPLHCHCRPVLGIPFLASSKR